MKRSSKTTVATALSLLVFPGTGHFVVGRPFRGVFWALLFGTVLVVLIGMFAVNFGKMAEGMMSPTGDVPMDFSQMMGMASLGLASFVIWGLAGLDAFWLARCLPQVPQGEADAPGLAAPAPPPDFNPAGR